MDKLASLTHIISLNNIGYILLWPLAFFWVWWILYVTRDISNRTENIIYEIFCILLAFLLWPIGVLIYLVIRPYYNLNEKKILESLLVHTQECPNCEILNDTSAKYCIWCWEKLKTICKECKKEFYIQNEYCPHCGAPNLEL